jgi:hypothetical protein
MSTAGEKDSGRSSRQRGSLECKPLIDAATKDLFRKNAFRITGLSVDATTREIAKHAGKIKMLVELGQDPHMQGAAFPLKPPPSLDEIREAIQKLKDPEKRLIDEFFWFWPGEFGNSQSDPAMQALAKDDSRTAVEIWAARENDGASGIVAKHNLALVYHVRALDGENASVRNEFGEERRQRITAYWKGAFSRWECLITSEPFWGRVLERIRQLDEPNLPTGFGRRMRAALPEALVKINAELALAFAESGKTELARFHIGLMSQANQGLDIAEKAAELVLTPARNSLKEQIRLAKESAQHDPATAHETARSLIDYAHPLSDVFDLFFGEQEHFQKELFDEAAATVVNCLVAYRRKTGDNETVARLLERTLPLAESVEVRQRIEALRLDHLYALLKSLQGTEHPRTRLERFRRIELEVLSDAVARLPVGSDDRKTLSDSVAIVLRGVALDAWNKHQDEVTALAATHLALEYAVSPELRTRLLEDDTTLVSSRSRRPQRQESKRVGLACLAAIGIFVVISVINSYNSTETSSSNGSYTPPLTPSAPAYTPAPVPASGNSDGDVYRLPRSVSSTFENEKAQIESERTALEALDAQVAELGREIENDRLYLDRTSQFDVDAFNGKVSRYNALAQKARAANAAFNEKVDNYNANLRQSGR